MIEENAEFLKCMQCKGVPFLLKPQKSGRLTNIIVGTMEVKYTIKINYLKYRNIAERLLGVFQGHPWILKFKF